MDITRYAIYFMPDGALGNFGAAWFGWDHQVGTRAPFLNLDRIHADNAALIKAMRKYGLHATLKSPFRREPPFKETKLILSFQEFCAQAAPAHGRKLIPKIIGGLRALAPTTSLEDFNRLARDCVSFFELYRALLNEAEIAKGQKHPLSQYQKRMLFQWGYPYVFDAFKFHVTLLEYFEVKKAQQLIQQLESWLEPIWPDPFFIPDLVLAGGDETGQFHELLRKNLKGYS